MGRSQAPRPDPLSQRLFWAEDPGGTAADVVRAEVYVTYSSNSTYFSFVREIAGPHRDGELLLPVLPVPLAQYNFAPDRTGCGRCSNSTSTGGT